MTVEYECVGSRTANGMCVARWRPRPAISMWLKGATLQRGRTVEIMGDPYVDRRAVVKIDGRDVAITSVERRRDGGTTVIHTTVGQIVRPTPLRPELVPTLDGDALYERSTP